MQGVVGVVHEHGAADHPEAVQPSEELVLCVPRALDLLHLNKHGERVCDQNTPKKLLKSTKKYIKNFELQSMHYKISQTLASHRIASQPLLSGVDKGKGEYELGETAYYLRSRSTVQRNLRKPSTKKATQCPA